VTAVFCLDVCDMSSAMLTWCIFCWRSIYCIVNGACKLFNIRFYATLCFNYFRWHRRVFSYSSVFELL